MRRQNGQARWQATRPRQGEVLAADDPGSAAERVLYSFTGTCKHHDIDPFGYLNDIFRRLPSHPAGQFDDLVPDVWFSSHPSARRKAVA
jgi:hypothetical protein